MSGSADAEEGGKPPPLAPEEGESVDVPSIVSKIVASSGAEQPSLMSSESDSNTEAARSGAAPEPPGASGGAPPAPPASTAVTANAGAVQSNVSLSSDSATKGGPVGGSLQLKKSSLRRAPPNSAAASRQSMRVDTETVRNISQMGVGSQKDPSLHYKRSVDTIRQPKSSSLRKKRSRNPVNMGNVPSKGDMFAAKVASAMEIVDDSDSDETFVYENIPKTSRVGSPTGSISSLSSVTKGVRQPSFMGPSIGGSHSRRASANIGKQQALGARYARSFSHLHVDSDRTLGDTSEDGGGTSSLARDWKRRANYGTSGMLDEASAGGGYISPSHKRVAGAVPPGGRRYPPSRHRPPRIYYEDDDYKDDGELAALRYPLLAHQRIAGDEEGQGGNGVMEPWRVRQRQREPMRMIMFIVCMTVTLMFGGVLCGLFFVQPLRHIELVQLYNIIASQDTLMLDMKVRAVNPSIVPQEVAHVNLSVFASSPYIGETHLASWWPGAGDDDGDPGDGDSTTLLLGTVTTLDVPLRYEPAFFSRHPHNSTAGVTLSRPANNTASPDKESLWRHVLKHEFELIVRGFVQYPESLFSRDLTRSEVFARVVVNEKLLLFDQAQRPHVPRSRKRTLTELMQRESEPGKVENSCVSDGPLGGQR